MFGIRSQPTKSNPDPLQSRRTVMAWFGQLPPLDVMARAQLATEALEAMHKAAVKIDRDRISALGYLDAAVESDLRRLVAWYLENHEGSPGLAERFWQAAHDLNAAFVRAFAHAVEPACAASADPRWKAVLPLLIAELIRCHGVDALLRLYRRQHWIPAKWMQLHALFRRATELGIERVAATPDSIDPQAPLRTIEQEYLYVLLIHLLDTGNLAPGELDWASQAILAWSGDLSLDAAAWSRDGFCVDLNGSTGLIRRRGNDLGTMVGYLDTTRLAQRLEAALAEAREAPADLGADAMAARERHIATLEKMRPALSPKRGTDYRRHPRLAVDAVATVRIGLPRICQVIVESDGLADDITKAARSTAAAPAQPFKPPSAFSALRYDDQPIAEPPPIARIASPTVEPNWRITDMSPVGFRMTAPDFIAPSLALGALVAARQAGALDWKLGVVRRLDDGRKGEIDAGVSLIAERVVAVTLYPQRPRQADMSFVVDGVDTSTIGARCSGLYPLPPAGVDASSSMRTLVVPVTEYTEGRRLILVTGRSDYMVVMRRLIDRHAEWIWVTMQIVKRLPRNS